MELDNRTMRLSRSHLLFKYLHRVRFPRNFYAFDTDLVLVSKNPPKILAILEFKNQGDRLSFSEVLGFNHLKEALPDVPIYIIEARKPFVGVEEDLHRFDVYEYVYGDWRPDPPEVMLSPILLGATWYDLLTWESALRRDRQRTAKEVYDDRILHDVDQKRVIDSRGW